MAGKDDQTLSTPSGVGHARASASSRAQDARDAPAEGSGTSSAAYTEPPCDGRRCDGRLEVDDHCSRHSQVGQALWFARQFAIHDPDVDWPSDKQEHPIYAIAESLDRVREDEARLREQRDKLMERIVGDPDRFAAAALDGLRKMLPELKAEEDEQIGAILNWIGVAGDGHLTLAERVRILALEHATKQGYSLEEAERLCP